MYSIVSKMYRSLSHKLIVALYYTLFSICCEGTSITLSPLGMVSVCPGGQVLLTCERLNGSVLYWTVSVPHLDIPREIIVTSQGVLLSSEVRIGFTEFSVTLSSGSPLISQLLINNVTTEINGSTIYCSKDDDETNAPTITVNSIHKDDSLEHSLNVTIVNQLLRSDDVTVTLQWPREPGAVYNVSVSPETLLMKSHAIILSHDTITVNLTISYNVRYDVTIVSSLCNVTATKILTYITCDNLPIQLLHRSIFVDSGSQDNHPLTEGQFITYTCHPGFILSGPNMSVCTGNREWEPDPGQVDCIADCGVPTVDRNVMFNNSISTLEGSILTVTCENEISLNSTNETTLMITVTCHSNRSWIPDPAEFTCSDSSVTTVAVSPGLNNEASWSILLIILIPSLTIIFATILFIFFVLFLCAIKRKCLAKKTSEEDPNQEPATVVYEEITIPIEGNAAYGHIKFISQ